MTLHVLSRKQLVPAAPAEVFAFFSRPENLTVLTPPELGLTILTPSPIAMAEGARIDYTIRMLGATLRWTSLITSLEPGRSFVDEQLRGPYASWRHVHRFEAVPGGTSVADDVEYALPLGPFGSLAHALFVRARLEKIFHYRSSAIARRFEPGAAESGPARAAVGAAAPHPSGRVE